jgi:uncharacterized protein YukE
MTTYSNGCAAVGGDPTQLYAMGDKLATAADQADALAACLRKNADTVEPAWQGPAGTAYQNRASGQVTTFTDMMAPLDTAASAYRTLAGELETAQNRAEAAMRQSVRLGLADSDLLSAPANVAAFVRANPEQTDTVSGLLAEVVDARANADAARDRFVTTMSSVRFAPQDRRGSDGTRGARQRDDRVRRRPPGGDDRKYNDKGWDFSSDWAGRAILDRYLRGGGDWPIIDDPNWKYYLEQSPMMRKMMLPHTEQIAQQALNDYLAGRGSTGHFDQHFHGEIENGEGMVGWQYLHGTDKTVGDFRYTGDTEVRQLPDGTYEVTTKAGYTWNDKIDPNPKYATDTWKSKIADVLTLGQAKPYDLHITWHGENKTVLQKDSTILRGSGFPAN